MNLLTPDPGLLFWMLVSFGIVFCLLAKFGFPVIVDAINKRKEFIEQSLLSAKQANEKLAGIQAEGERLLQEAKSQQQEIIAGAMAEKQKIVEAAQVQAAAEASRIAQEAAESIARAKEDALRDVRDEVATLALEIAEKVLREKMKDDKAQIAAVNKLLDNL